VSGCSTSHPEDWLETANSFIGPGENTSGLAVKGAGDLDSFRPTDHVAHDLTSSNRGAIAGGRFEDARCGRNDDSLGAGQSSGGCGVGWHGQHRTHGTRTACLSLMNGVFRYLATRLAIEPDVTARLGSCRRDRCNGVAWRRSR